MTPDNIRLCLEGALIIALGGIFSPRSAFIGMAVGLLFLIIGSYVQL